ncbi:hypothetical protein ACIQWV_07385 [Streptomyces sp. NPDC098085]|uniref:hypothetical protein n=1 Tax=Streptomyces sp. NPDC098085 TaxID=3366094 RepID=UPI00380AF6DA
MATRNHPAAYWLLTVHTHHQGVKAGGTAIWLDTPQSTQAGSQHMAMTIKVYEVDRYGKTRVVRPESEVVPAKTVDQSFAFPACECDHCKAKQS